MTELPDSTKELLASLEKDQLASHRTFRRATVMSMVTFLALVGLNAGLVLLGNTQVHDPWLWRNLVAISGLGVLGMIAYLGTARAYQVVVKRDAELLERYRNEARLAAAVDEMRPLMAAISDARARGVSLLIPAEHLPPTPDDQPTVH